MPTTDNQTLISFESATLMLTPATIQPPIYRLTVKGVGEDFGSVHLARQPTGSDGYIVYDVLVRQSPAIGSAPYSVSVGVQRETGTKGVLVRGARDQTEALPWLMGAVVDTDPAAVAAAGNLPSLAELEAARVVGSPSPTFPPVLEVSAQAGGFNYALAIGVGEADPSRPDYVPYFVTQTQTSQDWPPNSGLGPIVLPQLLCQPIRSIGRRGIVVFGANNSSIQFNLPAPELPAQPAP